MKLSLYYSLVVLAVVLLTRLVMAQVVETRPEYIVNGDRILMIKGRTAGSVDVWLWIEAHNGPQWHEEGFHPSLTRIVSQYKPLARKLPTGQYEIKFISEIATDLP